MDELLNEIEHAARARLYYLALLGTFVVPDTCAAAENANGETNRTLYIAWFDRWISLDEAGMDGGDAYRLRCSILHQSRLQHKALELPFVFQEPETLARAATPTSVQVHGLVLEGSSHQGESLDAVYLSAPLFIDTVVGGARRWLEAKGATEPVATNLDKTIRRRSRPFGAVDAIGHFIT